MRQQLIAKEHFRRGNAPCLEHVDFSSAVHLAFHQLERKRSFLPTLRSAGGAGEGCGLVSGLLVRA